MHISTNSEIVLNQGLASKQAKFNSHTVAFATVTKLFLITCWLQGSLAHATHPVLAKFVQKVITASDKSRSISVKWRCEGNLTLSRGTPNTYGSSSPWILFWILTWEINAHYVHFRNSNCGILHCYTALSSYMGNDVLEKTVACMSKVKPDD
jgi:hypothetical protein